MIAALGSWLGTHWKIFSVIVPIAAAGGGYVVSVEERIGALEEFDRDRSVDVDRTLRDISVDVAETRCMVILMNTGGNPLECINNR